MKWSDVTLNKFLQLKDIVGSEIDFDKATDVVELLFDVDAADIPLEEFNKYLKELSFLKEEIPNNHIVKKVTVNGREYTIDALLGHISTAQYVDFTNYVNGENNIAQILSVFFIPSGHKYNDGYDMEQVVSDMGCLPVDIAVSESFFFNRQFKKFIKIFQSSSTQQIRKSKMEENQKSQLINLIHRSLDLV